MGYGFDWTLSGLGLVFMGQGWAGLRIPEPMTNTVRYLILACFTPLHIVTGYARSVTKSSHLIK